MDVAVLLCRKGKGKGGARARARDRPTDFAVCAGTEISTWGACRRRQSGPIRLRGAGRLVQKSGLLSVSGQASMLQLRCGPRGHVESRGIFERSRSKRGTIVKFTSWLTSIDEYSIIMRDVKDMDQQIAYRSLEWNWPKEAINKPIWAGLPPQHGGETAAGDRPPQSRRYHVAFYC